LRTYGIEVVADWSFYVLFSADAADTLTPPQHPDILTCGVCQKPFALGDIMKFIQHKVAACNKENYLSSAGEDLRHHQDGSDSDDPQGICGGQGSLHLPLGVVNTRRPSISAPISSKKVSNFFFGKWCYAMFVWWLEGRPGVGLSWARSA